MLIRLSSELHQIYQFIFSLLSQTLLHISSMVPTTAASPTSPLSQEQKSEKQNDTQTLSYLIYIHYDVYWFGVLRQKFGIPHREHPTVISIPGERAPHE